MTVTFIHRGIVRVLALALLCLPMIAHAEGQLEQADPAATVNATTTDAANASSLNPEALVAWLDGFMPYALTEGDVAGAVVVVVGPDGVIAKKGYGYSDVAQARPVNPDSTLFRAGSISKLVTWTAVMQLVEQGRVDLDVDVTTYLGFPVPDVGEPITLRDILTHTTGFEDRVKGLILSDPADMVSQEAYLRSWTPQQIASPGSTPSYSNYATGLAGVVVEKVSGMSFDAYAQRHVFEPLGMHHSSFQQPLPDHLQTHMSQGYERSVLPPQPYELLPLTATGGLAASGADIGQFMQAFLQDGDHAEARILNAATVKQMFNEGRVFLPPLNRVALGFFQNAVDGQPVISHGGDTQWFYSWMHLFPEQKIGVFISLNSVGRDRAAYDICWAFLQGFVRFFLPPPSAPDPIWMDDEKAREYAEVLASNAYRYSIRFQSSHMRFLQLLAPTYVHVNDDHTISVSGVNSANGQPKRWRAVAPYVWKQVDGSYRLAARVESGRLLYWSHDQLSPHVVYEPHTGWFSPAWLRGTLLAAVLALAGTMIYWPVGALLGWRYRRTASNQRRPIDRAEWLLRSGTTVVVVSFLAWLIYFVALAGNTALLFQPPDGWVRTLYAGSVLAVAATGAIAWGGWARFRQPRTWASRLWGALLLLAALIVVCAMSAYGLLSFNLDY